MPKKCVFYRIKLSNMQKNRAFMHCFCINIRFWCGRQELKLSKTRYFSPLLYENTPFLSLVPKPVPQETPRFSPFTAFSPSIPVRPIQRRHFHLFLLCRPAGRPVSIHTFSTPHAASITRIAPSRACA